MATHNHFLISERGQRKETMTEAPYESRDKRERNQEKDKRKGARAKTMESDKEGERAQRLMKRN